MSKRTKTLNLFLLAALFLGGCSGNKTPSSSEGMPSEENPSSSSSSGSLVSGQIFEVESPDSALKAQVVLDDFGSLSYSVRKNEVPIVENSSLGFELEEENLSQMLTFEKIERRSVSLTYSNISGRYSEVEDAFNEIVLTLNGLEFALDLTMRAYDDGYAFRYDIYKSDGSEGTFTVLNENSFFALPESSTTWIQPYATNTSGLNCFSYEEAYTRRKSASLSGKYISMPMLYQAGKSDLYSLITESGLIGSGYYGSFLKEPSEYEETGILQTVHSPAGVANPDNVVAYPFTSPWRVGITGTLKEVTESELVEKVYDDAEYYKPDDYDTLSEEEKKIYDYDWVEPGVTAWNWLIYTGTKPQNDYDLQREYVDLAQSMGWTYTILDGGWNSSLDVTAFKEFVQYAHERNVKVLVWCNALTDFANGSEALLIQKLRTWKSYGVDGIKIDFFDGQNATNPSHQGEDIETIKWYETIYQETAKLQMVVNCHGSNKPTGERRVYPHVINREGVRGNEFKSVDSSITVNSMFTRAIVGPSDFTPVVSPLSKGMTVGHQMALAVLYESGAPSMADYASTYAKEEYNAFYKALPATYDDMVYIGGELDGYFIAARRKGNDWFIAGINAVLERDVEIDLSFLDEGSYTATVYTDGDDYKSIVKSSKTLTRADKENLSLVKNGGFVLHLQKN